MGIQQRNLKLVFRDIQPETLYESIRRSGGWSGGEVEISSSAVGAAVFQRVAGIQYPACAFEEISHIHRLMTENMTPPADQSSGGSPSVFYLLVRMAQRALRQAGDGLVCDFSETLAWRNVSLALGQDLFTTAFLAYEDGLRGMEPRRELAWDAAIPTDNHRLHDALRKGIAENHCHLGGTTQAFPLSWACLMNFPQTFAQVEEKVKENLHPQISRGAASNVWPWSKRLLWAQHLRLALFSRLEGLDGPVEMDLEETFAPGQSVRKRLQTIRFSYGARVPQPPGDGPARVLDYALRWEDCGGGLLERHTRLLSGERNFLYRCFRASFEGRFSPREQDWFYLYLLIKENFRGEIVQTNSQTGFYNFMKYQDRKDTVYDRIPGYRAEALRLAVNANQESQHIQSFELRIAPKKSPQELRRQLWENERYIRYAWGGKEPPGRHFYVYHFIKFPDEEREDAFGRPRNLRVRRDCRRQTRAIAHQLLHDREFCQMVYGIDGANLEIGCRPETFAVSFRYLRNIAPVQRQGAVLDRSTKPHIHATYHAGEDFLDIADGLRAIDEAVRFFQLRRGDRIAHALALGVDPKIHYHYKQRRIILPKQDFLDNVIWMLFRSGELNIDVPPQLRSQLEALADRLFFEIYDGILPVNRYEYYCAMQLRGDDPSLYYTLPYTDPQNRIAATSRDSYEAYRARPSEKLAAYRKSRQILRLCQCYHFDPICRRRGQKLEEYFISRDYMDLMASMQDGLAWDCARRGLMIECNPTSNYLIGTFRRYDCHPIFRFNNARLATASGSLALTPQLSVSVNTDDLGVFDTTLENEYAILAAALERAEDGEGNRVYTRDSIYQYLENLREMGLEQVFRPT